MQQNLRRPLLIFLVLGIAGTIQYHSDQFLSGFDTFFGDRGDARGFVYFCEHWYQSILGNTKLLSPEIFYPTKYTLAYSDLLVGFALPYSLFRALGFGMFSSVEIVVILVTFLSYCAMLFLLYKTLGFGMLPSLAGAMFFAFSSPKFHQTIHLQLQYVVLLPLMFALVISFARQRETLDHRRAAILLSLAAACFNLQLLTAFYYAWYFVLWTIIFLILALALGTTRRFIFALVEKFWRAMLIAAGVFVVGFIPILLLYLPTIKVGTWYEYDFTNQMIPDWRALLIMGDGNYVWGWLSSALTPDPLPGTWGELKVGIGLVASIAWIVLTVYAFRWSTRKTGIAFLGVMILAGSILYLIGFKYGGHSPWYFIFEYFPGGGAIRAVSRYVIFLTLPMAIAFAYALDRSLAYAAAQHHSRRQTLKFLIVALVAFGVFEQFGVNKVSGTGFSKKIEDAYLKTMASNLPSDCSSFYIAAGARPTHSTAEYQYDAMLISMISGVPTLNASSSQFPHDWNMYFVMKPDYEAKAKEWIDSRRIPGRVCRLDVGPQVEAFDPKMPSPVDQTEFFVRQLYRDFAGSEPDEETIRSLVQRIDNCSANDASCERAAVAQKVFLATGFHEQGSFVLRMYVAALGRLPSQQEFMDQLSRFRIFLAAETPGSAREHLITDFVRDAKLSNDGSDTRRDELVKAVENDDVIRRDSNRNFVALHYYGYLRREPDAGGLTNWTDVLDRSGVAVKIPAAFIDSVEYRERFRH
ncbi:MAG TPA: hypothetical protein VFM63_11600 [Pyrinomonadaceae bacterium]|nr:hypothetical protein [Pyrinomonadaceae bacterium]